MTDYTGALQEKVACLDSLDDLVQAIRIAAIERGVDVHVHSKGTWSRILNEQQAPSYPHLVEIALACSLPLPPAPPLEAAKGVEEWHQVGDEPPRFGVLLSQAGTVSVREVEGADSLKVVRRKAKPKAPRRKRKAVLTLSDIGPVPPEKVGRGKAGNPEAIRKAAELAAAELERCQWEGDAAPLCP